MNFINKKKRDKNQMDKKYYIYIVLEIKIYQRVESFYIFYFNYKIFVDAILLLIIHRKFTLILLLLLCKNHFDL